MGIVKMPQLRDYWKKPTDTGLYTNNYIHNKMKRAKCVFGVVWLSVMIVYWFCLPGLNGFITIYTVTWIGSLRSWRRTLLHTGSLEHMSVWMRQWLSLRVFSVGASTAVASQPILAWRHLQMLMPIHRICMISGFMRCVFVEWVSITVDCCQGKNPTKRWFAEWSACPKDIVVDFVCTLPHGTVIVMDSYYGSLDLVTTLEEMGYSFIMVCQANRPADV